MPRIRFTETRTITAPNAPDQVFEAGKVYDLSTDSAARWLRRGVAVDADEPVTEPGEAESAALNDTAGAGVPVSIDATRGAIALAEEHDFDLSTLSPGPDGKISKRQVERALNAR